MPTELLFRTDAYLAACDATVIAVDAHGGVVLDRTIFYALGGGQPGDTGRIVGEDGGSTTIVGAVYDKADRNTVVHTAMVPHAALAPGDKVRLELDWALRHRRMRIHTALHLLSCVLPYPVTGGAIGDGEGRLDFDIPDSGLDKAEIGARLQELVDRDAAVTDRWITDAELAANPSLVKTLSVQPPAGSGRVRLVEIAGIDLQPCGGTHVRNTGEIGQVSVTDIEKKGRQNRRVRIALG